MRQRDKWVIVFVMPALLLGPAACEGCNNAAVFVGDAGVIEADVVEEAEERDDHQESGDLWPEEPIIDAPVEISEIDEDEFEFIETTWSRVYATNDNSSPSLYYFLRETVDRSYIVAGDSDEFPEGGMDAWVLKLDRYGNVLWEKTYGKNNYDGFPLERIYSLGLTQDLGYVVGGFWVGVDRFEYPWVMKLGTGGNILLQKIYRYDGISTDSFDVSVNMIEEIQGGGYVACGRIHEHNPFATGQSCYIIRIDDNGQVVWSKQFGEYLNDNYFCSSLEQLPGGDLLVVGRVMLRGDESTDVFVQRLDIEGAVVWQKRYRRETSDKPVGLRLAPDGGYVMAVYSRPQGEIVGDAWFLKLDVDGSVEIQETIGGVLDDEPLSLSLVGDNGYILCADTLSFGAGEHDCWLVRLGSNGSILWQKSYGGAQRDRCTNVLPTIDGGFVVSGVTDSFGTDNLWVMKLDANGNISESCPPGIGADTAAVVQETFAEAEDISITVLDWDLIVEDLDIVPAESASTIETQCAR